MCCIILENFELSPREIRYYYILENKPCPCNDRNCTADEMEPCFIQNLYRQTGQIAGPIPAAAAPVPTPISDEDLD